MRQPSHIKWKKYINKCTEQFFTSSISVKHLTATLCNVFKYFQLQDTILERFLCASPSQYLAISFHQASSYSSGLTLRKVFPFFLALAYAYILTSFIIFLFDSSCALQCHCKLWHCLYSSTSCNTPTKIITTSQLWL